MVEEFLAEATNRLERELVRTRGFAAVKLDLKAGPEQLGTAIADAMAIWARETLGSNQSIEVASRWLPVVAFFNSSSYRRDEAIPAGAFTEGDLRSIYPMPNEGMAVFRVSGEELIELFRSLREHRRREQSYSPQLSANLRATESLDLEFRDSRGGWSPVNPEQIFALVADPWLSRNGFELAAWNRLLNRRAMLIAPGPGNPSFVDALRGTIHRCERFILGDSR
jgi:2',3'-cyclic-nucleotide 2'-phosphodiesterase (5'-nucleotidase family)